MSQPHPPKVAIRLEDQQDLPRSAADPVGDAHGLSGPRPSPHQDFSAAWPTFVLRDQVPLDSATNMGAPHTPSLRVFTELSLIGPCGTGRQPAMAPGVGGFNIAPPQRPASSHTEAVATGRPDGQRLGLLNDQPTETELLPFETSAKRGNSPVRLIRSLVMAGLLAVAAVVPAAFHDKFPLAADKLQEAVSPLYEIASTKWANESARLVIEPQHGSINEPLPIGISLRDGSGVETVLITGLGPGTELSLGTAVADDTWMISARDLDQTFVGAPKDFRGAMTARVSLRSAAGRVLDTQALRLQWLDVLPDATPPTPDSRDSRLALLALPAGPETVPDHQILPNPEPRPHAEPVAAPPINADQAAALAPPPIDADQAAALISLGRDLLVQGDVAGARVMFRRAAVTGNAQAALEVGMSFDPAFLQQRGVLGITPDVTQAIDWYKRARAAGSVEAFNHLKRLDPTLD